MRSLHIWMLLLSTLTACSTQPSSQQLAKELKTVTSWAATAHMVSDAWLQGTIPTVYARQTLHTAIEKLQKETSTLTKVAPASDQTESLKQLRQVEQTVGKMATAVEQQDRSALTQQTRQLSTQEQSLDRLIKTTGEQP